MSNEGFRFKITGTSGHDAEMAIIGRLLAGYGELEYALGLLLAAVLNDIPTMIRVLFRVRGEEARIQIADALMRHQFESTELKHLYNETISDMQYCKSIRNQFAHCMFDGFSKPGELCFVDLEKTAKEPAKSAVRPVSIQLSLLKKHEEYFGYVQWRLFYLAGEYARLMKRTESNDLKLQEAVSRPPLNGDKK